MKTLVLAGAALAALVAIPASAQAGGFGQRLFRRGGRGHGSASPLCPASADWHGGGGRQRGAGPPLFPPGGQG